MGEDADNGLGEGEERSGDTEHEERDHAEQGAHHPPVTCAGDVGVERLVEHLYGHHAAVEHLLRHVEGRHLGAGEVYTAHDLGHVGVDGQ